LETKTMRLILGWIVATAASLALVSALARSQEQPKRGDQSPAMNQQMSCTQAAQHMQQMMTRMKEDQQHLEQMVAEMKQTTGEAKVDKMAEIIETMVSQRATMRDRAMQGMMEMMQHMTGHIASEVQQRDMAQCPMMTRMRGMMQKERSQGDQDHR